MSVPPDNGQATRPTAAATGTFVGPPDNPDEYELVALVGSGGEAQVWRSLTRPDPSSPVTITVAMKIHSQDLGASQSADWMRRTQAIRHIHNPALARIHAAFIGAPMHPPMTVPDSAAPLCRYLVMEFVDGPSLLEWLEDNPGASLRERLRLLLTLAAGLDALHAGSSTVPPVAHGDVKPDNARLTPDGGIRLVDFGLLRAQGTTRAGPAMATLPYTAPEIFAAGENALPTPEADRFAFAATVFHVLTGVMPPLRADGRGPDLSALLPILERTSLTAGRPEVIATVMAGLVSDPVARPTQLVPWLAAARRTETGIVSGFVDPDNDAEPTAALAPGVPLTTPDLSGRSAGPTPPPSATPAGPFSAADLRQEPRRRSARGRLIAVVVLLLMALVAVVLHYDPWPWTTKDEQAKPRSTPSSSQAKASEPGGASRPHTTGSVAKTAGGPAQGTGEATKPPTSATLARRTLALGEELDIENGVIGTDVAGSDVAWDQYNVDHVYAHGTRFALVDAITTKSACQAALRIRQDDSIIPARDVSGGKALCLVTLQGHIAAIRITAIDVRNRAKFEYTYW